MPTAGSILLAIAAFVAMEPITAAVHRWVMHGAGLLLHRSHHRNHAPGRSPATRWEANDWYPVMFAAVVNLGFFAGFNWNGFGALVPVGVGITAYGAAYALVHDVYIHERLGWFRGHRVAMLDRLADAHAEHHRFGGAPYGMLVPIRPAERRTRVGVTSGARHQM